MTVREHFAAIEHERRSHWQRWRHAQGRHHGAGSLTLPAESVARWERRIPAPNDRPTARQQDADRAQVHRSWPRLTLDIHDHVSGAAEDARPQRCGVLRGDAGALFRDARRAGQRRKEEADAEDFGHLARAEPPAAGGGVPA